MTQTRIRQQQAAAAETPITSVQRKLNLTLPSSKSASSVVSGASWSAVHRPHWSMIAEPYKAPSHAVHVRFWGCPLRRHWRRRRRRRWRRRRGWRRWWQVTCVPARGISTVIGWRGWRSPRCSIPSPFDLVGDVVIVKVAHTCDCTSKGVDACDWKLGVEINSGRWRRGIRDSDDVGPGPIISADGLDVQLYSLTLVKVLPAVEMVRSSGGLHPIHEPAIPHRRLSKGQALLNDLSGQHHGGPQCVLGSHNFRTDAHTVEARSDTGRADTV